MSASDSASGLKPARVSLPKAVDIEAALQETVRRLAPIAGPRALIGGVALAVYGIERYTKDIDFAITVDQAGAVQAALVDADPQPLRIGGVSIETSFGVRVDLIDHRFRYRSLYEAAIQAAMQEGPQVTLGELSIPTVPQIHLLALKMAAGRPKDDLDIDALLASDALDYRAARALVEQYLGPYAADRLDERARRAHRADAPKDYRVGPGRLS